jgi:hypothetical protein
VTANRAMALRVVWATRVDDDTPAADARELLEMLGLVEPGGHEVLPDTTMNGRLLDAQGHPVSTAPPRAAKAPAPTKRTRPTGSGRKPIPIEHGTDHGYLQHKAKKVEIPGDDGCGCQAAHDATLKRPRHTTPTEGTAPSSPDADAAGTAPDPKGPGHGNAGPDAQPQVSPSRSHTGKKDGELGASDAPAELTVTAAADGTRTAPPDPGRQPPAVPAAPTDLDEWLAAAQRSRRPTVRRHAQTAVLTLLQLRCALDNLARAEKEAR